MKRLAVVIAVLLALAVPAAAGAQSIPVRLGGEASSLVGVPFDAPIVVDMSARSEHLGSYALRLSWDPTVLRMVGGADGTFGGATVNMDSAAQGVIRATGANPAGAAGLITVLVGRWEPLRSTETTVRLQVTELFAAGTFADLLPSVVASDGLFCPARGRYGDIDADRSVNSRDALIALSNAVGLDVSAFDITLGDVDASGATNARDALVILSSAVGLGVSGFRVNAIAGGTCVAGTAATLVITPAAVGTVLPGQIIRFAAMAREASGALQAVANVAWLTSNSAIVSVMGDGTAVTRDTGVAVISAVRDGRDTARVSVHVGDRRAHWVSAAAVSAVNRLGTEEAPWASPADSKEMMRPGDTLIILPGRYTGQFEWGSAILVSGRSSGGQHPVFVGDGSDGPALRYEGSGTLEVRNLTIDGYSVGIQLGNGASVKVDSLRYFARTAGCSWAGIEAWSGFGQIAVRRSQFTGDGQWDGCADAISVENGGLVEVEDVTISDFGYSGVYAANVDSVVVRRALIHDNGDYGIDVGPAYYVMASPAGGPRQAAAAYSGSTALVVEDSRLLRNYYEAVYAESMRLARITGTVVEMLDYDDALYVEGTGDAHGYLELIGDSLSIDPASYYDWVYASGLDSVRVEGVRVVGGYDGYFYNVGATRVRNSSIRVAPYGTAIDVGVGYYGGPPINATLDMDSVHLVGLPSCSRCATGVYTSGTTVAVNRFRGENLSDGIEAFDSSITVTNSVIANTGYGIYTSAWSSPGPQVARIRNVTLTDVDYGIQSENMTTVIDTLLATRVYAAVEAWDGGIDSIRQSTFTDVASGIELYDTTGYVADNSFLRPASGAIWGAGLSLGSGIQFSILRNEVTCDAYGAASAQGIAVQYADVVVNDNAINGCSGGILVDAAGSATRVTEARGNAVTVPSQAAYPGIRVTGRSRTAVVDNTVTGGGVNGAASIHVGNDPSYRMPWARVDSNDVFSAVTYGIVANETDTLRMFGNRVEDFASGTMSFVAKGAIGLYGYLRGPTLVQGNTIRRSHGTGIAIDQQDTVTVVVDSNAISQSDTAAVRIQQGGVWLKRNNIRNNALDGVLFTGNSFLTYRFEANAFQGNARYAVYNPYPGYNSVDARGNWWGVNGAQPGTAGADAVNPGSITDTLPLAAEPTDVPALAPRVLLAARPIAAHVVPSATEVVAARPAGRPAVRRTAPPERAPKPAAAVTRHERNRRPGAEAGPAAGPAGERANPVTAARRAAAETRARRDAERAARDSARETERERRSTQRRSAP